MRRLIMCLAMVIAICAFSEAHAQKGELREQVVAELQIKDADVVNDIFQSLELAVWRQCGIPPGEAETNAYKKLAKKAQSGKQLTAADIKALEAQSEKRRAMDETRRAELQAKGLDKLEPLDWLNKAVDRLLESQSDLSLYESRRRIIRAMHSAWPCSAKLYFIYLKRMTPIEDAPPPPPADPKYKPWLEAKSGPWYTVEYTELVNLPTEKMPDGAILPLLYMTGFGAQSLTREGMYEYVPLNVLKKYGPRLYPALVDYLAHPDKYGRETTSSGLLKIAEDWPDDFKKELWRAALMSGWNDVGRYLPAKSAWVSEFLKEFADSPYGKPGATGR